MNRRTPEKGSLFFNPRYFDSRFDRNGNLAKKKEERSTTVTDKTIPEYSKNEADMGQSSQMLKTKHSRADSPPLAH